jgi:transcriptional regulator with XRE-family HTH domain
VSIAPGSPDGPEEPVGVILARMRRNRGFTGAVLAEMVGMSQPKISRIERGKGLPDPRDVGILARALGADERQARSLMELAERSHDRMTDWRPASPSLASRQMGIAKWESAARVVREFEPAVFPGLLQSSGYARTILQIFQRVRPPLDTAGSTEATVLAAVSERIRRQEVLADHSKSFRFVITEAVLRNQFCPPAEMVAQISHLREISTHQDNVDIGVILDGTRIEIPPMHGFVLIDDKMIIIDAYSNGLVSHGREDVESYRGVFEIFESQATAVSPLLDKYETLYVEQLRKPRAPESHR